MQKQPQPREGKELRPQARTKNLVVSQLPDEELVYDLKTHQAFCLNKTVAFVWGHCDGTLTVTEIAQSLSHDFQTSVDEDVVLIALRQLNRASLLEPEFLLPVDSGRISRRQAMRALGATGLAIPLVTTIMAPQAAYAASCLPEGTINVPCSNAVPTDPTKQCCSGCCKSNADRCEGNVGMACINDTNCCTGLVCRGTSPNRFCVPD